MLNCEHIEFMILIEVGNIVLYINLTMRFWFYKACKLLSCAFDMIDARWIFLHFCSYRLCYESFNMYIKQVIAIPSFSLFYLFLLWLYLSSLLRRLRVLDFHFTGYIEHIFPLRDIISSLIDAASWSNICIANMMISNLN